MTRSRGRSHDPAATTASTPSRPAPAGDAHDDAYVRLAADLAEAIDGEVRFDAGSRAAYSTDASNYRQVPIGVVIPQSIEDVVATVVALPCARRPDH